MLEKYLPFLGHLPKLKKRQSQESDEHSLDSDLIYKEDISQNTIKAYQNFSILILAIFIFLTLINFILNKEVVSLDLQKKNLEKEISLLTSAENRINEVGKKINFYEDAVSNRNVLSDKLLFITDKVTPDIYIEQLILYEDQFTLSMYGKDVVSFTRLILNYLEEGKVSEIVLREASYDSLNDRFAVQIGGTLVK
ncbi:MAG TPA: hypothetical protein PKK54_00990 [bacterium]|nr:hypothetical protein [bacterium]